MGEVGEVIPEKSAVEQLPATTIASSNSTNTAVTSDALENQPAQQNGDVVKETAKSPVEPMAVDSDEDDSQTSCGDNQSDTKAGGESAKANGDVETSQDGSESRRLSKDDVETKDSALENGSEDEDNEDEASEKSEKSEQSQQTEKTENTDAKKNGNSTENEEDSQDGGESEAVTSQDDGEEGEDGDDGDESQDETSQSATNDDESQQSSQAASKVEEGSKTTPKEVTPAETPNGEVQKTEQGDGGIVDLGESDEEPMPDEAPKPDKEQSNPLTVPDVAEEPESTKPKTSANDSDAAVVIGSDSEAEQEEKPTPSQKSSPKSQAPAPAPTPAEPQTQPQPTEKPKPPQPPKPDDDDDDDDCVLIEDDSPSEASEAGSSVSGRQHKNMVKVRDFASFADGQGNDDTQPSPKRQKTFHSASTPQMAQITIKDARSLMSGTSNTSQGSPMVILDSDSNKLAPPLPPGNIYPVNILPAVPTNQAQSPAGPKAVPTMPVSPAIPALPTLSNANLLPGLTDDMFVLEAPSFIVPYIYEKPPSDNLREIVTQIETKFDLKKHPILPADDLDLDLDEDGKENEESAASSSKKKKRKRRSGDDSWSESEESADDDDDDSDSETRTKVLIKEASDDLKTIKAVIKPIQPEAVTSSMASPAAANKSQLGADNYFDSPLGKFFIDIGVGMVQEFVQADLIRIQKRKMRRSLGKNITEIEKAINALSGNLEASKKRNAPFKFNIKRCEFCNFKSESALAMAHHYETPHMNGAMYKCNFCTYEVRNASEIVYHMEAMHNIKARLFKHLPYHQCPNCGFEDNGKAKLARHALVCQKKFRPETNLTPPHDWEAPAKIPRIKPRHGLVGTATAYQAMAAQAAAQKAALATIQQQQQQAQQARNIQAAMASNNANKSIMRGRQQPPPPAKSTPNGGNMVRGAPIRPAMPTGMVLPNNYQIAAGQLIQAANVGTAKKNQTGQPSISITPLPRQSSSQQAQSQAQAAAANKMPPAGMKPGQNLSGNKAQFVICEICDGYIKDLEQLRNHMQWMHKVKIHPKMIYNRPPLNCQKCQFRFFTDQGLERHLLGSHGLVTSSMQEAANKGKDAGRCPVCGRMYQWKLLNHVSRDHHMTLKPAHLSYKCTVCTATFGMYKQFETHVYTAHSTVAKKAMDGKKNNSGNTSMANNSGSSGSSSRSGLSAANDTLLKPLKINDEITIIPQPASKTRSSMNNIESHVID
ncbi:uncharacterized protein LOC129908369 isoform X2 [Episyrphus balteatus]|uniref:uncharacterized protein LOC129908369 isoform X2 n=1 Tax=Episyrphus balteatus TaxID=286459 RepID=UPI0024850FC8|nr:uncharacterized protein LOC129908369 isoform X2 [Episyrphus balteatus]